MEFTMPTGARLVVSEASYEDVDELMAAFADVGVGVEVTAELLKTDMTAIKDILFKAYASPRVKAALFKCAERAMYENVRVTKALFDDPKVGKKARSDHFKILWNVVKVNCEPFFEQIFSALKVRLQTSPSTQESTSVPVGASA